ncbi:MAG: hypothetical protein V4709_10925 [Pseudomonadota bacterium]
MSALTLQRYVELVLPTGTRALPQAGSQAAPSWSVAPDWPPNLFLVAALLIEKLDLLARWDPANQSLRTLVGDAQEVGRIWCGVEWSAAPDAMLTKPQRAARKKLGRWWQALLKSFGTLTLDEDALQSLVKARPRAAAFRKAGLNRLDELSLLLLQLVAVADEASEWVGYPQAPQKRAKPEPAPPVRWVQATVAVLASLQRLRAGQPGRQLLPVTSLTLGAANELATVLPKARTPSVGCTLRSLSHNLSLLPPDTQVRTLWNYEPCAGAASADGFNILVVPFPYRLDARAFKQSRRIQGDEAAYFELDPVWLPPRPEVAVAEWLVGLIEAAWCEGQVHALVLPELAITESMFAAIALRLERLTAPTAKVENHATQRAPLEMFIAGVICQSPGGNRVNTCIYHVRGSEVVSSPPTSQGKHHRWKLDRGQLARYGLSAKLSAAGSYWEDLHIGRRELHFHPFREGSVLCALICEDLARLEPCQPVVRAVGPNLLIALLMDGPQLENRWAARYATVLAEDPGSSVLTLTSLGLMQMSDRFRPGQPPARTVALWKSADQQIQQLDLPKGHEALLACLYPQNCLETTLDGRDDDGSAVRWNLAAVIPVKSEAAPAWLQL